jgi:cytochrome c-type biogenesis protein CcmH
MKTVAGLVLGLFLAFAPTIAFAVDPDEMLSDPKLEARAEAVGGSLRCLVCQNESIEESGATLAHDLRVLVRERIKAGDTDDQVRQYIVSRYGEFVLLQPVFALHTLILWLAAPCIIVIGGIALIVMARRRRGSIAPTNLSAEEAEALEQLSAPDHRQPE